MLRRRRQMIDSLPTVHCGLFSISEDHIEKYQSLDTRFIRNRSSTFFFQAQGDCMSPLILENDILIVDRSIEVFHKRIVVVSVDGEMYCKKLIETPSHILLQSINPNHKDIQIDLELQIQVFGVVIAIARDIF